MSTAREGLASAGILGSWIATSKIHENPRPVASLLHLTTQNVENAATVVSAITLVAAIGLLAGTYLAQRRARE